MKRAVIVAAALGGVGVGVLAWPDAADAPERADAPSVAPPDTPALPPGASGPNGPTPEEMKAADRAFRARSGVGTRVRAYAGAAPAMSAAERDRAAGALLAEVAAREADGTLVSSQAPYLRGVIALAQHADDQAARDAALARIEADAEARRAAAPPIDHGAGFAAYKAREAQIVAEVQGRTAFPDGLSRSDYLRRELDRARIEAYGEEP